MIINLTRRILTFIVLFSCIQVTYGFDAFITANDINPGEVISFDVHFYSKNNIEVTFTPTIICPGVGSPIAVAQTMDIIPNRINTYTYEGETLKPDYPKQVCEASVDFISINKEPLVANFTLLTKPELDVNIYFCKDSTCVDRSISFIQGNMIYSDINENVDSVTGELIYPDGTKKRITRIDDVEEINAKQIGIYTVNIEIQKEGYQDKKLSEQFSVIENDFNIGTNHKDLLPDAEPANPFVKEKIGDIPSHMPINGTKNDLKEDNVSNTTIFMIALFVIFLILAVTTLVVKYYYLR